VTKPITPELAALVRDELRDTLTLQNCGVKNLDLLLH
jgi:hypothetical protein